MIYAIEAVGSGFIKFGRATSVGKRLKEIETGCPHELHLLAAADWPDGAESAIHLYLESEHQKGEWFRDGAKSRAVIAWMKDCEEGLKSLRKTVPTLRGSWHAIVDPTQARRAQRIAHWESQGIHIPARKLRKWQIPSA